jgi:hypothetical protein
MKRIAHGFHRSVTGLLTIGSVLTVVYGALLVSGRI